MDTVNGHGGYREGAGRKRADDPSLPDIQEFNRHRARHERIKADNAELDLSIKRGEHLPRDPIRVASATAIASVVQALRALPDQLEREFNLAPEVVEAIEARIDESLADLGRQFRAMSGD